MNDAETMCESICECGTALKDHAPLPRPGPLRSWTGERNYVAPCRPGRGPRIGRAHAGPHATKEVGQSRHVDPLHTAAVGVSVSNDLANRFDPTGRGSEVGQLPSVDPLQRHAHSRADKRDSVSEKPCKVCSSPLPKPWTGRNRLYCSVPCRRKVERARADYDGLRLHALEFAALSERAPSVFRPAEAARLTALVAEYARILEAVGRGVGR